MRHALTAEQILQEAKPAKRTSGIYFLIRDGEIVYVGQSVNVYTRIADHMRTREFTHTHVHECDVSEMDGLEEYYISLLQPIENILSNPRYERKYNKRGRETEVKLSTESSLPLFRATRHGVELFYLGEEGLIKNNIKLSKLSPCLSGKIVTVKGYRFELIRLVERDFVCQHKPLNSYLPDDTMREIEVTSKDP